MLDGAIPGLKAQTGGGNAIVAENQKPGTTAWQLGPPYLVSNDTDQWIRGYASAVSINKGGSITFFITVNPLNWKAPPVQFYIDFYRVGWYGGAGGRLMLHLGPFTGVQQPGGTAVGGVTTPGPYYDPATGLIACQWTGDGAGNGSYTLDTSKPTLSGSADWTSGIYLAVLTTSQMQYGPDIDPDSQSYIIFALREDSRASDLIFQQAVATYQAYNHYPDDRTSGKNLYDDDSFGPETSLGTRRAVKVCFDRPYTYSDHTGAGEFLKWELYFVRWLERNGYDVSYTTDVDVHANGVQLQNHKAVIIAGHSEYWSNEMRTALENARDSGTSIGIFGANTLYNQIRFEPSPLTGVANRVIVCYKEATLDPVNQPSSPNYNPALTTLPWRSSPVNRPEQETVGTMYVDYFPATNPAAAYIVTNASHPLYAGTGFANNASIPGILGYEMDGQFPGSPFPDARSGSYALLSSSPFNGQNAPGIANSSIYQAAAGPGAWVFNAGSIYWSMGMDSYTPPSGVHTGSVPFPSTGIQQFVANFLSLAVTGVIGPAAPANLTASAGSASSIDLSWTNHEANANTIVMERSLDNVSFAQIATLSPTATSYSDAGLPLNSIYYYRMQAQNAAGSSLYSNVATGATTQTPPGVPSNLQAVTASTTAINLSWTNAAGGGATAVLVERSADNITFAQIASLAASAMVYVDSGLTVNTLYYYRVRAHNTQGESAYSNTANAQTASGAPAAPTNLTAVAASTSSINLTWTNNATDASAMAVEISTDNVTFVQQTFVPGDATSYTSTGLNPVTQYFYRVRAHNYLGESAYSNVATATTVGVPATPTNLTATTASGNSINLAWVNNGTNAAAVLVEQSFDGTSFTQIGSLAGTAAAYTATSLADSTTYYYRVRAQNAQGTSNYSNVASATIPGIPAAPSNVRAGQSSASPSTGINVYWNDNSNSEDGFQVFRSLDGVTFSQIASIGSDVTEYDDAGLTPGTQYFYNVKAYNGSGLSAASNTDSTFTAA
jgi:hypothetical protein